MGSEIECHHCQHEWTYNGTSTNYVTCPNCLYKTKLFKVHCACGALLTSIKDESYGVCGKCR